MRKLNKIIVHCSATKVNQDIGVTEINNYHVENNGWAEIGYHFVIRLDGTIEIGRNINKIGAHCYGYNADSIGICLVGGLDYNGKPANTFRLEQFNSLQTLVNQLRNEYGNLAVYGHRNFANKSCPCFEVRDYVI